MSSARPRFEVADVVRAHLDQYRCARGTSATEEKVLSHIAACRTPALGGHLDVCENDDYSRPSYNSCQDRNCPKCQTLRQLEWLDRRLEHLLPVDYFHVVFTLPHELNALTLPNRRQIFDLLFAAASQSLQEMTRDPRHLGGDVGFTAVLHTWGQQLVLHPHLHCVVTGGGLAPDGTRWIPARRRRGHRKRYLVPVKALGRLFRGKFLAGLQGLRDIGKLELLGSSGELADPVRWAALKDRLYRKPWNVYAKPPFNGVEQVFRYLGRYTHRVAISNHRIVDFSAGRVTFSAKDYKAGGKRRLVTLDALEFLRRFLLHIVPAGFHRIRHYGLFAGANVKRKLAVAKQILQSSVETEPFEPPHKPVDRSLPWWERFLALTGVDVMRCPKCGGHLHRRRIDLNIPNPGDVPVRAPPHAA